MISFVENPQEGAESSGSRRPVGFLAFVFLLGAAFVRPLISLTMYAVGTDIHSHIVMIPFISAYLIYLRRKELPMDYVFSWMGLGFARRRARGIARSREPEFQSKMIVEAHRGNIQVESEPGKGTKFGVYLLLAASRGDGAIFIL